MSKDQSQAISGASVKISSGSVVIASAETDNDGKFQIAVPSGLLNVEISKENYITFESYETIYESDTVHFMEKWNSSLDPVWAAFTVRCGTQSQMNHWMTLR